MSRYAKAALLTAFFAALLAFALCAPSALAQDVPTPHGIAGYVFWKAGTPQVPAGTSFRVNESNQSDVILGVTGAGPFTGRYSIVINGVDGDYLVIEAWNSTAYGRRNTSLLGDMDNLNLNLSYDRSGESNVTLLYLTNGSVFDVSEMLNVTVNTTIIGPLDSINCSTHVARQNSTKANFTINDSNNRSIGDIPVGQTRQAVWNLTAQHAGNMTIWVYSACTSDGSNLLHEDWKSVWVTFRDIVPPNISLTSPLNGSSNTTTFRINFTFNPHEFTSPLVCSLVIDGKVNQTNATTLSNQDTKMMAKLPFGFHIWSVNCTDESGQRGNSSNYTLDITIPDFRIASANISFIPSQPVNNQTVNVNVSIENRGLAATNVVVEFIQNDTVYRSIANVTIPTFPSNSSFIANASFISHVGLNAIFVRVDSPDLFLEADEEDNNANASFTVSAWSYFHGNTSGKIQLANRFNISVLQWTWSILNVYVIETGADITWSALQPLGLTISNASSIGDFAALDTALGIATYADSVNATYLDNGAVRATESLRVFNRTYADVPVVNTTNSSGFVTGIFWDTDDGGANFAGTQDLLFVTEVNSSSAGSYGRYDYEIRVPPGLKDYRVPAFDTITFYVELS